MEKQHETISKDQLETFENIIKRIEQTDRYYNLETAILNDLAAMTDASKLDFMIYILESYVTLKDGKHTFNTRKLIYHSIISVFTKKKLDYKFKITHLLDQFSKSLNILMGSHQQDFNIAFSYIIRPLLSHVVRYYKKQNDGSLELLENINASLKTYCNNYSFDKTDLLKLIQKLDDLLFSSDDQNSHTVQAVYFIGDDEFKNDANAIIEKQTEEDKNILFQLIFHAQKATSGKPSNSYLKEAKRMIDQLGIDKFKKVSQDWFDLIIELKLKALDGTITSYGIDYSYHRSIFLHPLNGAIVKGFVWMNSFFYDNNTIQTIGKLAERCFKKIPEIGAGAPAIGNACLYTLFSSKGLDGIAQLSKLKIKVKQNSTLTLIEKYIEEAAQKLGITAVEVEDLAVDDFKLQDHKLSFSFDDFTCILALTGIGKSTLSWYKIDGSAQKSVPQIVKDKYAAKLKKIKEKQKQIDQTTSVQKERFDRMLRSNRMITLEYFKDKYLNHALLSFVINKLIFSFSNQEVDKLLIFISNQWIDSSSNQADIAKYTHVTLWHPVNNSATEVKAWRQFLIDAQIQQPFKQAFREVYLLTEAEINTRTYSNRMASHILKQHQYVTLAKGRNWKANLIGSWDGGDDDIAQLMMPEFHLKVEFWVNALNADDQYNDTGIWNYVTTDQIRFINTKTNEGMELINVPAVAFSEGMRDVDLFVGVASVGNDPTWSDSGGLPNHRDYWQSYSFGDLSEIAKSRKEILQGLIPRLKIASVAQVQDKYLVVKGKLRTYKIHIGSTNIMMEPNDQYLCIVPDRSKKNDAENIFLPFEGDHGLSIIISKALLLANDDKITDPTITSQINLS